MPSRFASTVAFLVLIFLYDPNAYAADDLRPLYIIFDGSNSMWGELPDKSRKIEAAKGVFNQLDASWFEGREVALRLYGHRRAKDCSDTELVVPFTAGSDIKSRLSKAIEAVSPRGKTPITRSLKQALADFQGKGGEILLISDGIETCDADPCELMKTWKNEQVDIRVHVVGLGLGEKARSAMQCISDVSGTPYRDANNPGELSEAIQKTAKAPPVPGEADPKPQTASPEFKIEGLDQHGNSVPVKGTISKPGMAPSEILSHHRYVFEGGEYSIVVGVPTVNGEIYQPVTQDITIKDQGTTRITVELIRPPTVRTKFIQAGEAVKGTTAYAYVDGESEFGLRTNEDFFILPGSYEFRANLRTDNSDLKTTITIADGEDKDIVFELIKTVHTYFIVKNKETGARLRQHQQLWQGGEKKYQIHYANGAKVQPGVYTLRSPSVLTEYVIENVEVPDQNKQKLEFDVQLGKAQIHYRVEQNPDKPDYRCWIYSVDENNVKSASSSRMQSCDGSDIHLSAGRYFVYTTKTFGKFVDTYFDVTAGETTVVDVMPEQ